MVMPDHSGRRVGGFELAEPLASGGFATVYRARQVRLDRDVAVKVLDPGLARDPDIAARFEREGRAAASLDHPNVVPVYEAGEDDGLVYLAMRLIQGETLDDLLLRGGPLTTAQTVHHIEPVAAALDHAHARGLIHRDVKPSNIFIEDGRIWLGDFGIAATADQVGRYTTGALGTAQYMAPEQASQGELDGRADLYALGCVVHRCLTGRPPYDRGELVATLVAHVNEPVPQTGHPSFDHFLAVALAKAPEDRFARGADLVDALRSVGPIGAPGAAPVGLAGAAAGSTTPAPPTSVRMTDTPGPGEPPPPPSQPQVPPPPSPSGGSGAGAGIPPPPTGEAAASTGSHDVTSPMPPATDPPPSASADAGSRDPRIIGGVAVAVVAALVAVGAFLLLGGDDGGDSASAPAETTTAADSTTTTAAPDPFGSEPVEATVGRPTAVGEQPLAASVVGDSVYVANAGGETVSQVPTDGSPGGDTPPLGARPLDVDGAEASIWVTTADTARPVLRFDRGSNTFSPLNLGFEAARVVADADGAWVSDPEGGRVVRLDETGAVAAEVPTGGEPTDLALAAGSLWVADKGGNTVIEVETDGATVVDTIAMDIDVGAIIGDDAALYVTDRDASTLTRIDIDDTASQLTMPVAERPTRPEVGAGGLWLLSPNAGTVHRYDAETLEEIQVVDVGGTLGSLAIDQNDDVWVTRFDAGEIVRISLTP